MLPADQMTAAVRFLDFPLLSPLDRALATAPEEDEKVSAEAEAAVAHSKEWLKHNQPIPHEDVLAEFGLTMAAFERLGRTPRRTDLNRSRTKHRDSIWRKRFPGRTRPRPICAPSTATRVLDLLHGLARFLVSEEGDVKRLKNIEPPEYRLRLGAYRLRFHDHGDSIEILHVRHRKDAYR